MQKNNIIGLGECSILEGISPDNTNNYENKLLWICKNINLEKKILFKKIIQYPSIRFGLEQAFISLYKKSLIFFPSNFTKGNNGILINGLVQRGNISYIKNQLYKKINTGFNCIKIKIGQNDFNEEYKLLKFFINKYPNIQIRVDANGNLSFKELMKNLYKLYKIGVHSIEQPIITKNWDNLSKICKISPIPIALDEEINGIYSLNKKKLLLDSINPHYLILKPSFCGGFKATMDWIIEAEKRNIKWWITSALETNIGLNAILQWTYCLNNSLPHGFDTINIYKKNNIYPFISNKNIILYKYNIDFYSKIDKYL